MDTDSQHPRGSVNPTASWGTRHWSSRIKAPFSQFCCRIGIKSYLRRSPSSTEMTVTNKFGISFRCLARSCHVIAPAVESGPFCKFHRIVLTSCYA